MTTTPPTEYEDESPTRRRARRILTTIVILACMVLLVVAAQHTVRGDKDEPKVSGNAQDNVIDLQAPVPESSVLSQAQITLGFSINYNATLRVNGIEIPTSQVQMRPELAQISFTPGPGKVFERLPSGRVCAAATLFRIDGVQEDPRDVSWCFNVT